VKGKGEGKGGEGREIGGRGRVAFGRVDETLKNSDCDNVL